MVPIRVSANRLNGDGRRNKKTETATAPQVTSPTGFAEIYVPFVDVTDPC